MSLFTPIYSAVSTATILNGQPNDATPVKDSFDTVNTFTGIIDDQRALAEQTSTINLVANRDIFVPVNCAGGAVTVNLPSGASHTTQPIVIAKVGADYNVVTIGLQNASDRIDSPNSSSSTPVATTFTLVLPCESIALFPILKGGVYYYRVVNYFCPVNQYRASAYRATNQALSTGTYDVVLMPTEDYDLGSFHNTSTGRFTPLIAGSYLYSGSVTFTSNGSTSVLVAAVRKNGALSTSESKGFQQSYSGDIVFPFNERIIFNGSTDYIETVAFSSLAGRNVFGAAYNTHHSLQLLART